MDVKFKSNLKQKKIALLTAKNIINYVCTLGNFKVKIRILFTRIK